MIRLHVDGEIVEFADRDAIVAHFGLSFLLPDTFAGIRAASDAGYPLHACIDPYVYEMRDSVVLMLDNDADDLRRECIQRRQDV